MGELTDEQKITKFFTDNSAKSISNYFKPYAAKLLSMSDDIILFCCEIIVKNGYQCHIKNKAMRECLREYNEWSAHINGGKRSKTLKMNDNLIVLSHQVVQYEKFEKADENDTWKQKILELCQKTQYKNDFENLFFGMCQFLYISPIFFLCIQFRLYYNSLICYIVFLFI